MPTVNRKFFFYDLQFHTLNAATNTTVVANNQTLVINNVFNFINTLPYDRTNLNRSRYYDIGGGNRSFIVIDSHDNECIRGRIIISRYSLLPDLEINGALVPIFDRIPAEAGLAEVTHFIIYLQHNIIGIEYNYFGPKVSSLCFYIINKAGNITPFIDYNPRLNRDIDNMLNSIGEVGLVDLELKRNALNIAAQIDESLGNAFEAAAAVSDSEVVQVVLKKKKRARQGFEFPFSKRRISQTLSNGDNREVIDKFRVSATDITDNIYKEFDLLEDKFIVTRNVIRVNETTKRLDSNSVYTAIEEGYRSIINEIIIER